MCTNNLIFYSYRDLHTDVPTVIQVTPTTPSDTLSHEITTLPDQGPKQNIRTNQTVNSCQLADNNCDEKHVKFDLHNDLSSQSEVTSAYNAETKGVTIVMQSI